jgi:transposase InsO family protein
MIDTGATHTLITSSFLRTIPPLPVWQSSTPAAFLGDVSSTIAIHGVVRLCVFVADAPTFVTAHIVDSLHTDVILGMDWCTRHDVRLCVRDQTVQLRPPCHGLISVPFLQHNTIPVRLAQSVTLLPHHEHIVRLRAPLSSASSVSYTPAGFFCRTRHLVIPDAVLKINNFHTYLLLSNPNSTPCTLQQDLYLGDISYICASAVAVSDLTNHHHRLHPSLNTIHVPPAPAASYTSPIVPTLPDTLTGLVSHLSDPQTHTTFLNILRRYSQVFDTSRHTIAKTSIPHAIVTGDHPPTSVRPYYRTLSQRKDLQPEVDKLLFDNIIRPSTSPWSSPVILKKKPDGTFRFLVDFRRLNSVTKKDSYPQPSAEELLLRLAGHRYFTKLDLKSGYFQIPITDADKEKTAFVTPDGHYEFNVLAQGLMNAPATFQRVMNNLIATGRWDYVVVYLDDIVIFSHTLEEHQRHVDEILSILARARFKVSPPKCCIAAQRIEFLGHFVTSSMVEPSPGKVQVILDIQSPRTLSQANRFLGKIGYYRKFIPDFARLAAPLHKVSNKTRTRRHEFYWGPEQQQAFNTFKQILTSAPLFLHFPDPTVPFILSTDASLTRIAGVLKQETSSGLKVCCYKSRLLNDVEQRYSATEREALAIYWCLDQLRPVVGTSSVVIETDHKPLVNMHLKSTLHNRRIDNWLLKLQDLLPQILSIQYRKGSDNAGPDFLTRYEPLCSSPPNHDPASATCDEARDDATISVVSSSRSCLSPRRRSRPTVSVDSTWPPGTQTCNPILVAPMVTRSAARLRTPPYSHSLPDPAENRTSCPSSSSSPVPSPSSQLDSSTVDLTLPNISAAQQLDSAVQPYFTSIPSGASDDLFFLRDNVVHRRLPSRASHTARDVPWLPTSLLPFALQLYHDHPLSGHFGVHRTLARLQERFWWPKMRATVAHYVASCDLCARYNILRAKPPGHLKPIDPPADVFRILHLDFWGPVHVQSSRGNRFVIVLTDNLSKYVVAAATPDCTAQTTANFLINHFILLHGAPDRIITDNGTHFNNSLLHAVTSSMRIAHAFSVAYHPQTNGQVERFNATFAAQLAKYSANSRPDWDIFLPSIVYAYNTSVHQSTHMTPYELAFARCPRSPFAEADTPLSLPAAHTFAPYLRKVRALLTDHARMNISAHQSRWSHRYDSHRSNPSYAIGDLVYVALPVGRTKLDCRRVGPCSVLRTAGAQTYFIRNTITGRTQWAHVNQLQPVTVRAL